MQLVRTIEVGMDLDGDGSPDLDGSRISHFGISFSGSYGTQFLGVEPDVQVGVLTSTGGSSVEQNRLAPGNRPSRLGDALAARMPPLLNGPGITTLDGVPVNAPYFNENMPLREGIPLPVRLEDGTAYNIQHVSPRLLRSAGIGNTENSGLPAARHQLPALGSP
jgi:hypothetical protein